MHMIVHNDMRLVTWPSGCAAVVCYLVIGDNDTPPPPLLWSQL